MNCSDCRFFKPQASRNSWGACRRYPPMAPDGMWPGVSAEAWCGEHRYATGVSYPTGNVALGSPQLGISKTADLPTITPATLREMGQNERELRPADLPPAKGKKA